MVDGGLGSRRAPLPRQCDGPDHDHGDPGCIRLRQGVHWTTPHWCPPQNHRPPAGARAVFEVEVFGCSRLREKTSLPRSQASIDDICGGCHTGANALPKHPMQWESKHQRRRDAAVRPHRLTVRQKTIRSPECVLPLRGWWRGEECGGWMELEKGAWDWPNPTLPFPDSSFFLAKGSLSRFPTLHMPCPHPIRHFPSSARPHAAAVGSRLSDSWTPCFLCAAALCAMPRLLH
ncbi:hypothetical protein QBC39DRAFT_143029 [Podospora conica]|nr:hypothetical protein QBC39DRAFT_143029 [Schizothecium conicum]